MKEFCVHARLSNQCWVKRAMRKAYGQFKNKSQKLMMGSSNWDNKGTEKTKQNKTELVVIV